MKSNTYYQVDGMFKMWEEDVYEKGCVGNMREHSLDTVICAPTVSELIEKICNQYGLDEDDLIPFGYFSDDPNRIEFSRLETDECDSVGEGELELWRKGECRLWNCTYTGYVKRITSEEVIDLKKIQRMEKDNARTSDKHSK